MSAAYLLAWLLPLLAGAALYVAACGAAQAGARSTALGYGAVLGLLLAAVATSIAARADTAHAWTRGAPWIALIAAAASAIAWRRRSRAHANACAAGAGEFVQPRWRRALLLGLLATLVARAALIAREVWLRPTYPWDAWVAWAIKAKAWFLLGHHVPYASGAQWLTQTDATVFTGPAWMYPDALAWIEVWFASAAGGWIEPLVNLPWLGVWVALLSGHYGQWRTLGLSRARALVFVYVLGSLPLINVHAALAGYADLWVAVVFGFGVLAWTRWLRSAARAQLAVALVCAAALPYLKLEGWVWGAALVLAVGFGALSARWRWRAAAVASLAIVVLFGFGGLRFAFAAFGWIDAAGAIVDPRAGAFGLLLNLHWHRDAALGMVETALAHPNWHLLWWLAPAVAIWRWRELVGHNWLWLPGLLLSACIAALLCLFTLTDAATWAQSFTAANRLLLQLAPACVSLMALLLRDVPLITATANDTTPESVPRSDPA